MPPSQIVLIGRAEQADLVTGVSSSYACANCCGDSFDSAWMTPDFVEGVVDGVTFFSAIEQDRTCYGSLLSPFTVNSASWESSNPSVAVCDGNGMTTAVGPGSATIGARWSVYQRFAHPESANHECVDETIDALAEALCDVVQRISGPSTMWWFNGESPSGYPTQITLMTSANATSYQWSIVTGSDVVRLLNNGSSSVTVESVRASAQLNDVRIRLMINGVASDTHDLTVLAPSSLEHEPTINGILRRDSHQSNGNGYGSTIFYSTLDQFGNRLPMILLPMREDFTSEVVRVFPNANWPRGPASSLASQDPVLWGDFISISGTHMPNPLNPCNPLCGVQIDYWDGEWRFGSEISGRGRRVQTNRWLRYQDHAIHTNRISP
ncbi:MAG: hypothetical protein ACRD9R_08290 [Pyrinomonadaceae bacterium]